MKNILQKKRANLKELYKAYDKFIILSFMSLLFLVLSTSISAQEKTQNYAKNRVISRNFDPVKKNLYFKTKLSFGDYSFLGDVQSSENSAWARPFFTYGLNIAIGGYASKVLAVYVSLETLEGSYNDALTANAKDEEFLTRNVFGLGFVYHFYKTGPEGPFIDISLHTIERFQLGASRQQREFANSFNYTGRGFSIGAGYDWQISYSWGARLEVTYTKDTLTYISEDTNLPDSITNRPNIDGQHIGVSIAFKY